MAHMVPVVFVSVAGGEGMALYVEGRCVIQDSHISANTVLCGLEGILYAYGTGALTYEYFVDVCRQEFPADIASIPSEGWEGQDLPEPCEDCGAFHEDGSC